jgi:hypothetical protein
VAALAGATTGAAGAGVGASGSPRDGRAFAARERTKEPAPVKELARGLLGRHGHRPRVSQAKGVGRGTVGQGFFFARWIKLGSRSIATRPA